MRHTNPHSVYSSMYVCMYVCLAGDGGGDAAGVNSDLYCDTGSIADSDVSLTSSVKSTDSRFTRSTG